MKSAVPIVDLSICGYSREHMVLERMEYLRVSLADCNRQPLPVRYTKFQSPLQFDTIIEHWVNETDNPSH